MSNRLRQLRPRTHALAGTPPIATPAQRLGYRLGVFALLLLLFVSPNLLALLGVDYDSRGGNPLIKFHPATYVAMIAACLALCGGRPAGSGVVRLFRTRPSLAVYLLLIPLCAAYSIANVGISGSAIYIETYFVAGMVTLALENGTDTQRRFLARLMIAICVLNVVISVGESLTQKHLIPMQDFGATPFIEDQSDFRGAALYVHPLTGSLMTTLGLFLLLGMRVGPVMKSALFTTFVIGLFAFGGRTALGVTVILLFAGMIVVLVRGLVRRNLNGGFIAALAAGFLLLLPLLYFIISMTSIGDRIMSHLYMDDSADVRAIQWLILDRLNLHDVVFGVPLARVDLLKYQIGLGSNYTDIENFWLLMFLNLGIIGFLVWLVALSLFFLHHGRRTRSTLGWVVLLAFVVIDSSSNSLGRKCSDLVFLSAFMIALSAYRPLQATSAMAARPPVLRFVPRRLPAAAASGHRALSRLILSRQPTVPAAGMKP